MNQAAAPSAEFALSTGGSPTADARLARADSLAFAGRMSAAARLYRSVIDEAADAGQYARDPLWHLAMAYYLADDAGNTVRTLDQLASAASEFGDPQTEMIASYEAARFYAALGNPVLARDRVARVHRLMQSPAIPASVKEDYTARMGKS